MVTFLWVWNALSGYCQSSWSIKVSDQETGEVLPGVTFRFLKARTGSVTNDAGQAAVRLPDYPDTLVIQLLGYRSDTIQFTPGQKKILQSIRLVPEAIELTKIDIRDEAPDANVKSTSMGMVKLDIKEVKTLPTLFGEVDVIRTLQLLPGVQSAGEGNSSFFVRGGNYDQNLVLLDNAPIYNASHVLGFFSVFNSDMVKDLELYKAAIPAQYGNRLSSVLDINSQDGDMSKYHLKGGIGILSSRIAADGPIPGLREKASFAGSFRRTYFDMFLKLAPDDALAKNSLYFYDANAKLNFILGPKDRLTISGYMGEDVFTIANDFRLQWGNKLLTANWFRTIGQKSSSRLTLYGARFNYLLGFYAGGSAFNYETALTDFGLQQDFNLVLNESHRIKTGIQANYWSFQPGDVTPGDTSSNVLPTKFPDRYSGQYAAYVQYDWTVSRRWSVSVGYRHAVFQQYGPNVAYVYPPNEGGGDVQPIDSTVYTRAQVVQTWQGPEPRVGVRFLVDEHSSLKASYNRTQQFLHIASNSGAGLPTDLWVSSSHLIPPQRADQLSIGYFRNFKNNAIELSVEAYWKRLYNQIDFRPNARLFVNKYQDAEFLFGDGWAYGTEWLVKKNVGKFTGWLGYTLSWSTRRFDEIDDGRLFYARNDRRHNVSIVTSYTPSPRWNVTVSWVYATGLALTAPSGKYMLDGQILGYYTGRNEYRMPTNHRMDLSVTLFGKPGRKFRSNWNFSVYNLYARKNPFSIRFESTEDGTRQQAVMVYLYTIVPSVTWNFEF